MRTFVIFIVQFALSLLVTVSLMPFVLITTPAAQSSVKLGLGLMAGVLVVSFTLITLAWPRRLR